MVNRLSSILRLALAGAAVGAIGSLSFAAPFTAGNIVVLRVGDGSAVLVNQTAAPVFLDEYTPTGSLVQSIGMPTSASGGNFALTLHGVETAVGALNRSVDGRYLTLGGYDAAVGTANLTSSTVARVIALVDSDGNVDTTTTVTDGFGRFASVMTEDGTEFWSTGNTSGSNTGGLRYTSGLGATTTTLVVANPNNLLMAGIFQGQLYTSVSFNSTMTIGVAAVGSGIPTSAGESIALLPGFFTSGTHAPRAYYFRDANTIYLADTQTSANMGGLQKWTQSAGTWTLDGSPFPIASPTTSNGLGGLIGTASGGNVTLFATSVEDESLGNAIVKFESADNGASFTPTILATAPTGAFHTLFRGIAFVPEPPASGVGSWTQFE